MGVNSINTYHNVPCVRQHYVAFFTPVRMSISCQKQKIYSLFLIRYGFGITRKHRFNITVVMSITINRYHINQYGKDRKCI